MPSFADIPAIPDIRGVELDAVRDPAAKAILQEILLAWKRLRRVADVTRVAGELAGAHTLLNAATHTDTALDTVTRGSLIYGNSTPAWDELVIGAANRVLGTGAGTDVAWVQADHGLALSGLTDDDHTQYALLAGRATGQTLIGGTASGDDLTLQSTSNASRGNVFVVDTMAPSVDDGAALGTTTLGWSDLHLAENARINFSNSDALISHTAALNSLTIDTDANNTTAGSLILFRVDTVNCCKINTTALSPDVNDGLPLGTTALGWSDLHLATGALVNVANGDAVITHSSGIFTVSTGDLRVTTAGTNTASVVTVGGTQTLTSKTLTAPVLGTPASGDLSNCTGFDWELLASSSPSAAAAITFTGLSSTYAAYKIVLFNLAPSDDGVLLYLRTSTDGGSSYDAGAGNYQWANLAFTEAAANAFTGSTGDTEIQLTGTSQMGNASNEQMAGEITIFRPSAAQYCRVTWHMNWMGTSTNMHSSQGSGCRSTAADVDAVQILFSAGTLTGEARLYGLRNA